MATDPNIVDEQQDQKIGFEEFRKEVLADYRLACLSREASIIGRKEVLTGKAKFGIFGDGKEVPQLAMAKAFRNGDFRSGYYRDQTFVFATGMGNVEQFFSQLYADTDLNHDIFSGGRQMNAHFATRSLDDNGQWKNLADQKNSSADSSPTASQMARSVGLALASKIYRENDIPDAGRFSRNGDEVTFCTIGDASTSEGIFWEAVNAAGVMRIPLAISIWDDGYGISVPKEYQTTKGSISEVLEGFRVNEKGEGFEIYTVNAWDYPSLVEAYQKGIAKIRETHTPAIFHIRQVTQPQGHSTSGSHERYKSKERLEWEEDFDCIRKMRQWIEEHELATGEELDALETEARKEAQSSRKTAWQKYLDPIKAEITEGLEMISKVAAESAKSDEINQVHKELSTAMTPIRRDLFAAIRKVFRLTRGEHLDSRTTLVAWAGKLKRHVQEHYSAHLHSQSTLAVNQIAHVPATYSDDSPTLNGYEILNKLFDHVLTNRPDVFAFGEDVGKIGDVNQGFAGMQEKHGEKRVFDTGIREATIIGQGLGMAMRGLRPIAEIQYLDYLIYGLEPVVDDLATLQYRSRGGQKAPMIIRTRGHRLEGIWHTGSPIGMILNSIRGINLCVPRNMVQAAGMYSTLLKSDEPGLIIECLNGYRLKEQLPDNIGEFTVPFGQPEIVREGSQFTLVSYGSTLRIVEEAAEVLAQMGIDCEVVDVQTLIPFDVEHQIVESLKKTSRIAFIDEDVPGGATGFMMQQVLEAQNGYFWLDAQPITITAKDHRSAYASDGDYFCKPNLDDIVETIHAAMHEADPEKYPSLF